MYFHYNFLTRLKSKVFNLGRIKKKLGRKKTLRPNKFWARKKCVGPKMFGSRNERSKNILFKNLGPKKLGSQRNLQSKKITGKKD